jgi:hypothetical protein
MRKLALLGLLLGITGCGRGCTCIGGKTKFESLDGKVKVTLVRDSHWATGKVPGVISNFHLHVETKPPFDFKVACQKVELAEDDAGKNIAYRCDDKKTWSVLRLRGGDHHVHDCDALTEPDFKQLKPIAAVVDHLLDCKSSAKEVVRAVREDGGDAAATVFAMSARPLSESAWPGFDALDESEQRAAEKLLCKSAKEPASYARAAQRCPVDGDAAIKFLEAELSAPHSGKKPDGSMDFGTEPRDWERALLWASMIASEKRPADAGAIACRAVKSLYGATDVGRRRALALAIVGRTKTACPAITMWPAPCGKELDCDERLCTADELAKNFVAWDLGERKEPEFPDAHRMALLAAYANGPLPKEITLPNARRWYTVEETKLPSCKETMDAGTGCSCPDLHHEFLACTVAVTSKELTAGLCSARFDDESKQIVEVKRSGK